MKAVVYNGPRDVSVESVPDAKIEQPNYVIVKITTTNICGSDLHMYEGRTDFKPGGVFGHEDTGEVVEVGPGISRIKKGDQSAFLSTSVVASVKTVKQVLPHIASPFTQEWPGLLMALPAWGLFRADKRNTSASPTATSIVCAFLRTQRKSRTIMHFCPTYFPPVGTVPALHVSNLVSRL